MTNLEIGRITKPQGVRGEFRLRPNTLDYEHYVKIKKMQLNGKEYGVESSSLRNGFVVVKLAGINDRNTVESLVGATIRADLEDIELNNGEYLVSQLVECNLFDEKGTLLGDITNVADYGAGEVYSVISPKGKEFMFPNVRSVIMSVDVNAKKVVVNSEILSQIISE